MSRNIVIEDKNEKILIKDLEKRTDIKAERIKRLLNLPDLTKKENSPVKILVDRIKALPRFKDFDLMDFPAVMSSSLSPIIKSAPSRFFFAISTTSFLECFKSGVLP